jgi:hypothetical protein
MFVGSSSNATHAIFDGMPGAHEVFSEMPSAHRMFTDEEGANIMNEMIGDDHTGAGVADDDAGEDEIEDTIEVMDTDVGKSIGKRKSRGPVVGNHHSKRKSLEDECFIDSWKAVILDPVTGANQTLGKYYTRILDEFNECRHIGDYAKIHMNRNEGSISHRWSAINAACNKFHGNLEIFCNRKTSGASAMDEVSTPIRPWFYELLPIHVWIPMMCALLVVA